MILILIVSSSHLFADNKESFKLSDTAKVIKLNELSRNITQTDTSIALAKRALDIAEELNYKSGIRLSLHSLGLRYYLTADYSNSLKFFHEELELFSDADSEVIAKAECLRMIGEVLRSIKEFDKALVLLSRAEKLFISKKEKLGLSKTYNRIASIYFDLIDNKEDNRVVEFCEKSNFIAMENGFKEVIANNFNILATYNAKMKNYDEALKIYRQTLEYFDKDEVFSERPNVIRNIANTFFLLKQNDSALYYAKIAFDESKRNNINYWIYESAFSLFKIYYDGYKNYDSAIKYLRIETETKDKIFNEEKYKNLIKIQYDYESKIKDKEIKSEQEKNFLLGIVLLIVLFVLIGIIAFVIYKNKLVKKTNLAIQIKNDQLAELNATKDKFFSIIAHDLKNPIGALKGLSKLLHSEFESISEFEKLDYIKIISESSDSVLNLLENILTWSYSQRNKIDYNPEKHDLKTLVDFVISVQQLHANSKWIKIINEIPENTFSYFDVNMINTVVRNLISNAIKFSYQHSSIFIKCERITENGAEYNKISIIDSGIGIDQKNIDSLFLITSKSSTLGTDGEKGTGLGLILAHEFVTKNQGRIWIESTIGVGTRISFTLPIND